MDFVLLEFPRLTMCGQDRQVEHLCTIPSAVSFDDVSSVSSFVLRNRRALVT